jgi:hypothetical protein
VRTHAAAAATEDAAAAAAGVAAGGLAADVHMQVDAAVGASAEIQRLESHVWHARRMRMGLR